MNCCCTLSSIFPLITLFVSVITVVGVGCFMLCRYQSHKHQLENEKAKFINSQEEARLKRISEYKTKILDCVKSANKNDEYENKQEYITRLENFIKEESPSV